MKELITVFTPTYNRGYKIKNLYKSLLKQTNKNFEWLIIDDGSIDNTRDIIESFIKEKKINIRYIYKENEGKSIAINKAAETAHGELIFFVDSDDILTEDAIDKIIQYYNPIKVDTYFAGIAGLKGDLEKNVWSTFNVDKIRKNNGTISLNKINNEPFIDATAIEYRYKHKISGDRAEVIKTEVLKKYPFPKIKDENFMPESYLWFSLSKDGYKFRWFNEVIYIAEYLEDGLTKNGKELSKKNSKSKSYIENFFLTLKDIPIKVKLKSGINYFRYGHYSGYSYKNMLKQCNNKLIGIICLPIAMIYKVK